MRQSTLRKTQTVHPRGRVSQSERLSRPQVGQHPRPTLFGRQRATQGPSRAASALAAGPQPPQSTLGERQPTRDAQPNSTNHPTHCLTPEQGRRRGHVPSRYSKEGKDNEEDSERSNTIRRPRINKSQVRD
nr:MAG TPA: hypothetical protein [Caudoviricetes sp.]